MISDSQIERMCLECKLIDPYKKENLQPASYDLTLNNYFRIQDNGTEGIINPNSRDRQYDKLICIGQIIGISNIVIKPGEFILAESVEKLNIPDICIGRLEGKSSLGRIGLLVHITAGFFDPGFQGTATLELLNVNRLPIRLHYGMKICQMSFSYINGKVDRPYGHPDLGSKYQGQTGPTAAK